MLKEENLFQLISTEEYLEKAWKAIKKTKYKRTRRTKEGKNETYRAASTAIERFKADYKNNIKLISNELKSGNFEFQPTKAVVKKKDNGSPRFLQIPKVRDRVVLKAIALALEKELKPSLKESEGVSFAYQKGLGVKNAVMKMKQIYTKEKGIVLKTDIINFFPEIDQEILLKKLFPNLKDDSISLLIEKSLNPSLTGLDKIPLEYHESFHKVKGKGIPQGNSLSPLLSNIYLLDFDKKLKEKNYDLVRYADDFIVLSSSTEEAKEALVFIKNFLRNELSLEIHPLTDLKEGKTRIVNPQKANFSFLSIKFDGNCIYPKYEKLEKLKKKITKEIKNACSCRIAITEVMKIIKKWISTYSYTNVDRYFKVINYCIIYNLKHKFGKRRFYRFKKCEDIAKEVRERQNRKIGKILLN